MVRIIALVIGFAFMASPSHAVATPKPTLAIEQTTQEATRATSVIYALPYPGILADHPLYFLKALRDRIMERLIADPARKIEFYILQGDKSLNSAVFLGAKGKDAFAQQAIIGSEEHMEKALTTAKAIKVRGGEVPGYVIEHLTNSLRKHEEVLTELVSTAGERQKSNLTKAMEFVGKLQEETAKLDD